jgi:hypothetical protein
VNVAAAIERLGEIERSIQIPSRPGQREIALQAVHDLRRLFYSLALCESCVERCRAEWTRSGR